MMSVLYKNNGNRIGSRDYARHCPIVRPNVETLKPCPLSQVCTSDVYRLFQLSAVSGYSRLTVFGYMFVQPQLQVVCVKMPTEEDAVAVAGACFKILNNVAPTHLPRIGWWTRKFLEEGPYHGVNLLSDFSLEDGFSKLHMDVLYRL